MTAPSFRFLKKHHVRRPVDFKRIYARRASAADDRIVVYTCENEVDHPRIGLSVSRKVGGAVERNRWKRLLREAFRLSQHELPAADLVIIPRPTYTPQLVELQASLVSLSKQASRRLKRTK